MGVCERLRVGEGGGQLKGAVHGMCDCLGNPAPLSRAVSRPLGPTHFTHILPASPPFRCSLPPLQRHGHLSLPLPHTPPHLPTPSVTAT